MNQKNDKLVTWITEEITKRGWSIRELGRKSDMSHATISNVLSGQSKPTFEFCSAIAKALNTPPEILLNWANILPIHNEQTAESRELVFLYSQLKDEDKESILIQLRALARERGKPHTSKVSQ